MSDITQSAEQQAEQYADNSDTDAFSTPEAWNRKRDAYLAGYRSRDSEVERLSSALRELVAVEDAPACLSSADVRAINARFDAAWIAARAALKEGT